MSTSMPFSPPTTFPPPANFVRPEPAPLGPEPRFSRGWISLGCTLIGVGGVWLLANLGYLPEINWVWVLGLLSLGMLPLGVAGLNKITFILCGFFTTASVASVLVQTNRLELNLAIPVLVIAAGLCTLLSMVFGLRTPNALRRLR
jgi:hypothetical protein